MLVLTGENDGDQEFLDGTLDGDYTNNTQHGVGRVPKLKEPLQLMLSRGYNTPNSEHSRRIQRRPLSQQAQGHGRWQP